MAVHVSWRSQGKPAGAGHKEVQASCYTAVRFMLLKHFGPSAPEACICHVDPTAGMQMPSWRICHGQACVM